MSLSKYIPIIGIGLLIAVGLLGYFFWWPEYQEMSVLQAKVEVKKEEMAQSQDYLEELRDLENEVENYQEELDKVTSALPAEPSLPALFNYFQKVTAENGLILQNISASQQDLARASAQAAKKAEEGEQTQQVNTNDLPLNLTVSGSYSAFKNFLNSLYSNARIIEVLSINFTAPDAQEGEEQLFDFELQLKTHIYKQPEVPSMEFEEGGGGGDVAPPGVF